MSKTVFTSGTFERLHVDLTVNSLTVIQRLNALKISQIVKDWKRKSSCLSVAWPIASESKELKRPRSHLKGRFFYPDHGNHDSSPFCQRTQSVDNRHCKKTMATGLSVQKWQILITYWNCCDCYATGWRNSWPTSPVRHFYLCALQISFAAALDISVSVLNGVDVLVSAAMATCRDQYRGLAVFFVCPVLLYDGLKSKTESIERKMLPCWACREMTSLCDVIVCGKVCICDHFIPTEKRPGVPLNHPSVSPRSFSRLLPHSSHWGRLAVALKTNLFHDCIISLTLPCVSVQCKFLAKL